VAEDRRFHLVDASGRLVTAREHGPLLQVRPTVDGAGERLTLRFPGGDVVAGAVADGEPVTTAVWDREVAGHIVDGPWSAALSDYVGRPVRLVRADRAGAWDAQPVTLLSDASVDELGRRASLDGVDGRRFRMLVALSGCAPHEEDGWRDRRVAIGEAVVRVGAPVARCVVTTLAPDTGRRDLDTLRSIIDYRGLRDGRLVDFGVYATVEQPGRVAVGDAVEPG
jgi:uncharacterized protein YcbX